MFEIIRPGPRVAVDQRELARTGSHYFAKHLFSRIAVLWAAILLLPGSVHAGTGTFTDGKFNFCVSVRFNATEAQLQLIRKAFEDGSQILADATDGQHRFGIVNIVNNDMSSAEQAEFWILPNAGQTTATFGRFGKKGQHVLYFFSPDFTSPEPNFAPEPFWATRRAYTIAHEFGHHAYDLLDEYKNRNGQSGPAISCPPIPADGCNPALDYCLMDRPSDRGGAGCPTTSRIHTMNEFCVAGNHDKANASGDGNGETAQSIFRHRSCWETIARLNKPWKLSAPALPTSTSPNFQPVTFGTSCGKPKVAIVIDRSGSMTTDNRLSFAKLGAEQFINTYSGGSLAVVSFSNSASVNFTLTEINDDFSRNNAKAAVNGLAAGGATNIGDGLLAALGQLNSQGDCLSCEKTIVLLSDGEHNVGTPPESVVSQLNANGVKLITSVVGANISVVGEAALQNITTETNGEYYRISTATDATGQSIAGYGSSGLVGLFMRLGSDMKGDALVKQQQQQITSGQVKEFPILVETRAANATFAATIADQADTVSLSLRSPSGVIYTGTTSPNVEFTSSSNAKSFRVNAPESGTWTMVTSAGSIRTGKVEILSFAKHDGVRLDGWVDQQTVVATEKVQVYAMPTFEGERVVGASVTGVVGRPDGSRMPITLFDNGLDSSGDVEANDGIYSVMFNSYTSDGTYVVELRAQNSIGRAYAGEPLSTDSPSNDKPLPPFIRSVNTTATVSGILSGDVIWFDDALPEGAIPHGDDDNWYWVNANPGPLSGTLAHQSTRRIGFHQHYFEAASPLQLDVGEKLFTYAFLDINSMPDEIMLQWKDGNNWEHRAYWGQNRIGFGIEGTNSRRYMGPLPAAGKWVRLEVPASSVGLEGASVTGMAFSLYGGRATWDLAGKLLPDAMPVPSPSPGDFVWVEDAVPAGSILETFNDQWEWLPPHFSGQLGHRSYFTVNQGAGQFRSHSFRGAATPMNVQPGDVLFTYVFLDANHMPDQLVLQWHDGASWEHRAYWGLNYLNTGTFGTESNRYMGGLPAANRWVRLEVPASYVGLEGKSVTGMSYGFYSKVDKAGINWDYSGKKSTGTSSPLPLSAITSVFQFANGDRGVTYSTNEFGGSPLRRFYAHPNQAAATVPFYRFRRPDSGNAEKFFAQCLSCYDGNGWILDGIAFYVYPNNSTPGTVPLYLYHDNRSHYFLTTDLNEANANHFDAIWAFVFPNNPLVPNAPSNLFFEGWGMRWRDNSATETGFKVERHDYDSGGWNQIATVSANTTFWKTGSSQAICHSYRVRATNSFGDSAYSNAAASCWLDYVDSPNNPPDVYIVSPISGEVVGSNFGIFANVTDAEGAGTIAKVEFYADGTKLAESNESPYWFTWWNAPSGLHTLTAVATDTAGASKTSAPVTITVNNYSTPAQIVLASNRDGSSQLYAMSPDGTSQVRLTNNIANDESPRWSPNNTRIVFQSDRENPFSGAADIYVMNPDGSGQTRLTFDAADDSAPVWSPDGTKIAFQSARNGSNYQVYVMNADGSGQVNISNSTSNDGQPSWSPNGTKIAFASDRDHPGKASIYVMNANGSNQTRLTLNGSDVNEDQPAWSADGSRIAFVSTRDSIVETWQELDDNGEILIRTRLHVNKELYVMNADGTNQIRLTNTLENEDSPVWSRDGTNLLFRSDRERDCCDPVSQIWVMSPDGSNQLNLSNNSFGDFSGSW